MAQAGYTPISLYHSSTPGAAPTAGNLVNGELALNTADGKLYYKDAGGVVQSISGATATYTRTSFTATAGQTTFSVTYTVGFIEVFLNGVLLNGTDYTASNGTTVVLATGAALNDIVEFIAYNIVNIGVASSLASTLNVAGGGTGQTSLTANNVILGNGTSAVQFVAPGTNGNVLTSNGTTWTSAAPAGGGFTQVQIFTSSGTWTIPSGVTKAKVYVVGAGGGSPASPGAGTWNGSGAAGGTAIKFLSGLTPGNTITVTVGVGAADSNGGNSSISSGTQTITTVTGNGGATGTAGNTGAVGGTATNGDINITGQGGLSGGGGGPVGGAGGTSFLGGGGEAQAAGKNYGGGAGASRTATTYAGGNGVVVIEY